MREPGIMQNLLEHAVERAKEDGASHINVVHVGVGEAADIVIDSLDKAFEASKYGTIAEGATLDVEYLPLVCYCATCHIEFRPLDERYECPDCHQPYCEVRQGNECELMFLDVS